MKNSFFAQTSFYLGVMLLLSSKAQAQSTTTIYTPKGTAVSAYILEEWSPQQIEQGNAYVATNYPNAQPLTSSSNRYNCHAYAWYLSEAPGSPWYWLDTPSDDTYWLDGSYIQICNEWEASKISYASDDHSAVRSTAVAGKYESKWGRLPLMRHDPTYTPYNSSVRNYYVRATINNSSSCDRVGTNTPFSVAAFTGGPIRGAQVRILA
ncbi:hypothetical protein [Hymenobacter cellulosilyticus]|uniref:Uncharacterized protein n=1 Tax=Hymenobacter cellulosilyticus TaxID=2932248 RepID=A0A8T9Q767_9BACT|nr:hypothetical protein [Hymenobacter cellulosilyticus]UOQ71339.1 hypothetical protein MUN79_22340 [Hymenobacter cellulosilyticus]